MKRLIPALALVPGPVLAAPFERPVPAAQTATVEVWFALAGIGLILALGAVHWLVRRR